MEDRTPPTDVLARCCQVRPGALRPPPPDEPHSPVSPDKPVDIALLAWVYVSFAAWLTLHVAVTFDSARGLGWAKAMLAFIILPLAPYFAVRSQARRMATLWGLALGSYLIALWFASR